MDTVSVVFDTYCKHETRHESMESGRKRRGDRQDTARQRHEAYYQSDQEELEWWV